jgi:hypothetical protein
VEVSFSKFTDATLADGSPGSGIDPASIPSTQTINTSGVHPVCATVTDKVGNVSAPGCRTVQVEATPPSLEIQCPATALTGSNASAKVTASDAYSGLQSDPSGTVPIDTSHAGEQTVTRTAVSHLGLETTKSCTTVVESSTPGAPALTAGTNPTKTGRFTLGWSGPDPLSYSGLSYSLQHRDATETWSTVATNIGALSYAFTGGGEEEGTWEYRVQGSDPSVGLTSEYSPVSAPVVVDRTPPNAPTAGASRAPDFAGKGGWFKDSVTVSFTANGDPALADGSPGSGVEPSSLAEPQTYTTSGSHTASGTVADKAGNVSATDSLTVQVDATPPTLTVKCPATAVVDEAGVTATVSASDGESGLQSDPSGTVPIDTKKVGPATTTRTAIDNVGHETTRSCTTRIVESPPELGRCLPGPFEEVAGRKLYRGGFAKNKCTLESATHEGKFEWSSGPSKAGLTTAASGGAEFAKAVGAQLRCTGEQGSGTIATPKSLANVVMRFTGCEAVGVKCASAGHVQGEIETQPLEGKLGWISKPGLPGLLLQPAGGKGAFMEYGCGASPITISGGVIVPVKAGKMLASTVLKYSGKAGVQKTQRFEGEPTVTLRSTEVGGQPVGLTMRLTETFEEPLEVNPFI